MDLPPKIRSDYHHQSFHVDAPFESFRRWVRPSIWIILGFIIGLMCTHMLASKEDNQISFTENLPTMAYQTHLPVIEESAPTANA